jgi:hypothetical protein
VRVARPAHTGGPVARPVWGPRFSAYVIAARDRAVFTLGRLPAGGKGLRRAEDTAARLHAFLDGRRMRYDEAGLGVGVHPNALRYAAPTGTVLIRWEGARLPVIWTVPRPEIDPRQARLELARRYLNVFGPTTSAAFARWGGIGAAEGAGVRLIAGRSCTMRAPVGGVILTSRRSFRQAAAAAPARSPCGPYFLLHESIAASGPRREQATRAVNTACQPGAVLVGEVVGTWHDEDKVVAIKRGDASPPRNAGREARRVSTVAWPSGQIVVS